MTFLHKRHRKMELLEQSLRGPAIRLGYPYPFFLSIRTLSSYRLFSIINGPNWCVCVHAYTYGVQYFTILQSIRGVPSYVCPELEQLRVVCCRKQTLSTESGRVWKYVRVKDRNDPYGPQDIKRERRRNRLWTLGCTKHCLW